VEIQTERAADEIGLQAFKLFKKRLPPMFRRSLHHDKPNPRVPETMKKISRFAIGVNKIPIPDGGVNSRVKKNISHFGRVVALRLFIWDMMFAGWKQGRGSAVRKRRAAKGGGRDEKALVREPSCFLFGVRRVCSRGLGRARVGQAGVGADAGV
jgi:hypothetical protein